MEYNSTTTSLADPLTSWLASEQRATEDARMALPSLEVTGDFVGGKEEREEPKSWRAVERCLQLGAALFLFVTFVASTVRFDSTKVV